MSEKYTAGFMLGWYQLRLKDRSKAKEEIKTALGLKSESSLSHYRTGKKEPKASQAVNVEKVFKKYGITNIWGK